VKVSEIREKPTDELLHDLHERQTQMLKLRFQRVTERELRPSEIQVVRKDIAKIKTILREREIAREREEKAAGESKNG